MLQLGTWIYSDCYYVLIHSNGLTRLKCLTCETRRRDYSTNSDCPMLPKSISAVVHIGSTPNYHFRSADATVENAWNHLVIRLIAGIHRQNASHALGTAQKRNLHI